MKLLLLLLIFIPCSLTAQNDIRNVNWGWSKAQVKKAEVLPVSGDYSETLYYKGTLADTKFKIFYVFLQNKLTSVVYVNDENYSNSNDYIRDFDILSGILNEKYGASLSVYEKFTNDSDKEIERKRWGYVLNTGRLTLKTKWANTKTNVILIAYGQEYKTSLSITYESVELQDFIKKYTKDKNDKDF